MTRRLPISSVCLALVALLAGVPSVRAERASNVSLRRYALVIGSNYGGGGRDLLRYAGSDAEAVADVLRQLGGVSGADIALLREPDTHTLDRAFGELARRVLSQRRRGQRVELVVYYSGHADERGILLGGTRYGYTQLRRRIRSIPADVHIAIVDSCASGSFTRIKGGVKRPAFLRDSSNQVQGHAFLSSSSADENAQESDRIGASFFTHFLVAALRGAADRNRDGRVTLTEAYQFAYEHTLGRTQSTVHGAQHPAYDMHLSGTGDIVITDLRSTESALILPAGLRGRITVTDKGGRVAVELTKDAGDPLSLALPNQTYTVHVEGEAGQFVATVTLDRAGEIEISEDDLRRLDPESTLARGAPGLDGREAPATRVPISFGGGMRLERPSASPAIDALVTLGGTSRDVYGHRLVGVAESGELFLGATLGEELGFAYDLNIGFGPGLFLTEHLQVGATIGFGFSGITGGVLDFAWKVPTEAFAVLELSTELHTVAYFRQTYLFSSAARQDGSELARWGDESEAGAGFRFTGDLKGFFYGSLREMAGERYWGVGLGAIL